MIASAVMCANGDGLVTVTGEATDPVLTGVCGVCKRVATVPNLQAARTSIGLSFVAPAPAVASPAPVSAAVAAAPVSSATMVLHPDDAALLKRVFNL